VISSRAKQTETATASQEGGVKREDVRAWGTVVLMMLIIGGAAYILSSFYAEGLYNLFQEVTFEICGG